MSEGVDEHTHERAVSLTYVVVERLGLAGMFACLPPVRSGAVQIPEDAADRTGQQLDTPAARPVLPEADRTQAQRAAL